MKTILHPDYWAEIPAGEYLTGISNTQAELIRNRMRRQMAYDKFSTKEQRLLEQIETKLRQRVEEYAAQTVYKYISLPLTTEEKDFQYQEPFKTLLYMEQRVAELCYRKPVWLDQFYIARFPLTKVQYLDLLGGKAAEDVPGTLEHDRNVEPVDPVEALRVCEAIGGRFPTNLEWEKAARGADGRLYPWGNHWDPEAGFFYYGQETIGGKRVDAFPRGVSPYGVWSMVGGLPELTEPLGKSMKGCHAREGTEEMAWFQHLIFRIGGLWVSCRPVLDKWPRQQWRGFGIGVQPPNAEAVQKMGPLVDLVITQYDWSTLTFKNIEALKPAITALQEGNKAGARVLLAEISQQDVPDEPVQLLLTAASENHEQQHQHLERVISNSPNHDVAHKMINLVKVQMPVESYWFTDPLIEYLWAQCNWEALEASIFETIEPAIMALARGDKKGAQVVLTKALQQNATNEPAWLWLGVSLTDPVKQRECIEYVLKFKPDSKIGQNMAEALELHGIEMNDDRSKAD